MIYFDQAVGMVMIMGLTFVIGYCCGLPDAPVRDSRGRFTKRK